MGLRKGQSAVLRSSHLEVFCLETVLKNFAKFTGKHLCQSPFFHKVGGLRPASLLLKKRLWYSCFPVNLAEFLRTPFSIEHLRWLPLSVIIVLEKSMWKVNDILHKFLEGPSLTFGFLVFSGGIKQEHWPKMG